MGIFLALIGYLVYFNVELRDEYANSPYNSKRQGTYQEAGNKRKKSWLPMELFWQVRKQMRMEM